MNFQWIGWIANIIIALEDLCVSPYLYVTYLHIVPFGKFHRIGGAPPKTFPNVKHDAPEEVGGNRKCFDSPIRK